MKRAIQAEDEEGEERPTPYQPTSAPCSTLLATVDTCMREKRGGGRERGGLAVVSQSAGPIQRQGMNCAQVTNMCYGRAVSVKKPSNTVFK